MKGNPLPTSSLRTLTLFALLGVVKLGPFRVALSTLNKNIVSSSRPAGQGLQRSGGILRDLTLAFKEKGGKKYEV